MAPSRASSKAARMLGIPDFPPLSPQDATLPTQRRQSVASIDDDDDAQDHLSYASSEKTSAKSSFRMTVSTVASASTAASEYSFNPRARARPASPSPSTLPSTTTASATLPSTTLRRPPRPSPRTVAALLSSRPTASVENLALPDAASDSDPLSPLPLSAFPLPPTTIPIPPPLPAISAHRERPPSPLTARRPPRPQRAPRRPSTADATVPGIAAFPSRSSTADSFYGASTSSTTSSRHAPSGWTNDVRPATPSERHILHPPPTAPLPPPPAPLPSAPLPSRPAAPARRPPLAAPSGKAALLLGVGEPGRPATPEAHKKHRLLRKFMPRPHTADSDHHAPDFGSNHAHGAKAEHNHGAKTLGGHHHIENAALAAKREAERIRHDAEVRHALHAFVYADPHPDWPPKVKKPKQTGSSAAMKGRSGWW
ncbi:hypothetical protein GGF50DRAFT_127203 [Schizophyllum commune]